MTEMNSCEVLQVQADLLSKGITDYTMRPGNECIWVSERKGNIWLDYYYIFRNGKIAEIQID